MSNTTQNTTTTTSSTTVNTAQPVKRGRGRPKGSKNKPKATEQTVPNASNR